jgi:hypothetical protein
MNFGSKTAVPPLAPPYWLQPVPGQPCDDPRRLLLVRTWAADGVSRLLPLYLPQHLPPHVWLSCDLHFLMQQALNHVFGMGSELDGVFLIGNLQTYGVRAGTAMLFCCLLTPGCCRPLSPGRPVRSFTTYPRVRCSFPAQVGCAASLRAPSR